MGAGVSGFSASKAQRAKVRDAECIVCGWHECDPAHLISRAKGGGDDPLDVVPLCRADHRGYDTGRLSILEYLEPNHREELAFAVKRVGLLTALQTLTNSRWEPKR